MTKPPTKLEETPVEDEVASILPAHTTEAEKLLALRKKAGTILAYGSLAKLSQMFDVRGWGLGVEVRELVAIASQDEDLGAKLRAIGMLRQLRMDVLSLSGALVTATRRRVTEKGEEDVVEETVNIRTVAQLSQDAVEFPFERSRGVNPAEDTYADPNEESIDVQAEDSDATEDD